MAKQLTVREALKDVFRRYRNAEDTNNRELRDECREFIRVYYYKRHDTNIRILDYRT